MGTRIFISYRTSDGRDKATALARDLGLCFGDEQVFLDKDDLHGGASWREEVTSTLGGKPVLLLLLTPELLGATGADGRLRIADPDDPVRREFAAALKAGAHIVPVLCDGVDAAPVSGLPAPFDRLGDLTWRRLRAYDWKNDLARLIDDLQALGVVAPAQAPPAPRPTPWRPAMLGLAVAALALAAVLGWRAFAPSPASVSAAAPAASAAAPAGAMGLPGTWIATVDGAAPFALTLLQQDERLALTSEPMPIDSHARWASYREFWLRLTGTELKSIKYRGQGTALRELGEPLTIDIAWKLFDGTGGTQIDSGNLHAIEAAGGKALEGELWSNADQAARPVKLVRPR